MKNILSLIIALIISITLISPAGARETPAFNILPLGTSGGELEDNLSAYLIAPAGSNDWIALDAGTVCSAIKKNSFSTYKKMNIVAKPDETLAQALLLRYMKAYLISHAHLDHINGLVMCSTIDNNKPILGTDTTINYLRDDIFNWKIWPNFADEGQAPLIKQYHYQRLALDQNAAIPQTKITVTPFLLNHGNHYPSTAFLLQADNKYLLYFGDTGADSVEHDNDIHNIWEKIAPLIRAHQLAAILIEASYPNGRADNKLYGHLTPHLLQQELHELAKVVNPQQPQTALRGLPVIITHIKQGLEKQSMPQIILQQLNQENDLKIQFIIPKQDSLITV